MQTQNNGRVEMKIPADKWMLLCMMLIRTIMIMKISLIMNDNDKT